MKLVRVDRATDKFIKTLSVKAQKQWLIAMADLQHGFNIPMPRSRPMNVVSMGVSELRLKDRYGVYRIFYYLKLKNEILVFYAFQKKTQQTPLEEIETARGRLRRLLLEEKE